MPIFYCNNRMFAPSNTFFLWGHGADKVRGEYRLKPDEYLLMAASCGRQMEWSLYDSDVMLTALASNTPTINIPSPNSKSVTNDESIYGIYGLELYRPKSGSANNPAYYKLPEIYYQTFNTGNPRLNDIELNGVQIGGYEYSEPVKYLQLGISGIQRPGTVFKWSEELIKSSNDIGNFIANIMGEYVPVKSFIILDDDSPVHLHCLYPVSALNMTLKQAEAADQLTRQFAATIRAAYSISFWTLDDIELDIFRRTGEYARIIDIMNYLMDWKDIYGCVRSKGIEGPVVIIHKICRSLDLMDGPKATNAFPKSFNNVEWSRTGVNRRRRIIEKARTQRNPRNNGYISANGSQNRRKRSSRRYR